VNPAVRPTRPVVLMVTGAYYPELSGGGLQARGIVRALRKDADFFVLTTTTDRSLPSLDDDEGVDVRRIYVDVSSISSRIVATARLIGAFAALASRVNVIHVHGFSRKAIPIAVLARLFRKRLVLTLHTAVHDDPATVRSAGPLSYWAYRRADVYLAVSPGLGRAYTESDLPPSRFRHIGNAVDTNRFRPPAIGEQAQLRRDLGLRPDVPLVLFVGFFSKEKRPHRLYEAWRRVVRLGARCDLVFVGATRGPYAEIDPTLAEGIRVQAEADGAGQLIHFVEMTQTIEQYFRAADVYVLTSVREGSPVALLEAMASGLPCVASRLEGSTDVLISDGLNGRLVTPDDVDGFAGAIGDVLSNATRAAELGRAARRTIIDHHSVERMAPAWLAVYQELLTAS
jgi:glycosyltransferase involved in cell wall biosynthesis